MDERLTTIKGIGPGREKQLHKLGITNITSLLTYLLYKKNVLALDCLF